MAPVCHRRPAGLHVSRRGAEMSTPRPGESRKARAAQPLRAAARAPRPPLWQILLFSVIACAVFFAVIEGVLALAGFRAVMYERDPYVGFVGNVPLFVKSRDAAGRDVYVTARNKLNTFNPQSFPAHKAPGAFRIFCMGGSSTYGHPYHDLTSFCGWMRVMLPDADPSRTWEVVNCGGISYASYREALLMEELIRFQPDLFVIWTGQNEFLEHRTYSQIIRMPTPVRGLASLAAHTRVYAALKDVTDHLRAPPKSDAFLMPGDVKPVLEGGAGPEVYSRDEELRGRVVEHFRFNLARMVDIAHSVGARVIFVNPASNLRDCSPFKSQHRAGLTEPELQRWQAIEQAAAAAYERQDFAATLAADDAALAIDDRYAEAHYQRGRSLSGLGRYPEARAAFVRARDEDVCPLRAITPILDGMREVAAQRGVPMVDFAAQVDRTAAHQIPGDDWFLDHVHPTIEGNRQLALEILGEMTKDGTLHPVTAWTAAAQERERLAVQSHLDRHANGDAMCNVARVMAWAGKYEDAYRASLRAVELAPDDAPIQLQLGKNAVHIGRTDEAIPHLQRALDLDPKLVEARLVLAAAYANRGQVDEAIAQCRAGLAAVPTYPELRSNLAVFLMRSGRIADAIQEMREALRLEPNYAEGHSNLAWLLQQTGQDAEAIREFREACRLKPGLVSAQIGLAWLLATDPDASLRSGGEAVVLGERLADISHDDWRALDVLAAGYAEQGRYPDAVKTEQQAVALVEHQDPAELPAARERLELYESGRPYRLR